MTVEEFRAMLWGGGEKCRENARDCKTLLIFYDAKLFQTKDNKASGRQVMHAMEACSYIL